MMLEVRNISKSFNGKKAVDGVSFGVREGEAYGLLGPNGAGKSTTLNMVFGLLKPGEGEIFIDGIALAKDPVRVKALMGYVPQGIALYPELTAAENLAYWGRMYGLAGQELKARVAEALDIVGLSDRAKGRIETFSGGMKRRINIAAGLLHHPRILIMDEPTVGVDPQSRNHILDTVKRLNQEGMTIVYTSHYMEEVEYLCSRIAIVDYGKIIAEGTVPELRKIVGEKTWLNLTLATTITPQLQSSLSELAELSSLEIKDEVLRMSVNDVADALSAVTQELSRHNSRLRSVDIIEPNLESVFLHLTGRALRD